MREKQCKDCQHFLQHYILNSRSIQRVYCGHCTFNQIRRKQPDSSACKNFTPGIADEESFVSKEYLSKELLEYVLSLELLPEIDDAPAP